MNTPTPEQCTAINAGVELEFFGDDLKAQDDDEIELAVWSGYRGSGAWVRFLWYGVEHKVYPAGGETPYKHIYRRRHDQPWQADLEAHVAAWRRPARDFCGDDNLTRLMREKIAELGLVKEFLLNLTDLLVLDDSDTTGAQVCFDFMQTTDYQQCLAALAAVRASKGGAP